MFLSCDSLVLQSWKGEGWDLGVVRREKRCLMKKKKS